MKTKRQSFLGELQKQCKEQQEGKRNDLKCEKCGLNKFLTVDHIIPVNLLLQFCLRDEAYNLKENFEILCKFCNTQKAGRLDVRNPKTFEVLEIIIERTKNDLKFQNRITKEEDLIKENKIYKKRIAITKNNIKN